MLESSEILKQEILKLAYMKALFKSYAPKNLIWQSFSDFGLYDLQYKKCLFDFALSKEARMGKVKKVNN